MSNVTVRVLTETAKELHENIGIPMELAEEMVGQVVEMSPYDCNLVASTQVYTYKGFSFELDGTNFILTQG